MNNSIINWLSRSSLIGQKIKYRNDWDMSDIFIVSYPKSGTTWLCLLMANIINRLANDSRRVDFYTVHDYVPDYHANPQQISKIHPQRFIKTHEDFISWKRRIDVKGRGVVMPRVIYLLRDGRNTMASAIQYSNALKGIEQKFKDFVESEKKYRGDWADHVNGWLSDNEQVDQRSVHVVKYEDMKNDVFSELRKIIDFSGLVVSDEILNEAISSSDISAVRELESRYGAGVVYKQSTYSFAREGKKRQVSESLQNSIDEYYKNNLSTFNAFDY